MTKLGLSRIEIKKILDVCKKFSQITQIVIFGSRAKGNFEPTSDIDLAIKGNLNLIDLARLKSVLEEKTSIPYFFDVVSYNQLENQKLKTEIDKFGQILDESWTK